MGLHFFSFWPFGLDLLSFWLFGPSFSFILAFWAFISFFWGLSSFHFGAATWGPPHKLPKTVRFLIKFKQILSAAKLAAFCYFWPFGPSFLFILAFWAFISFHFGLLGLHFLSFWGLLGLHFLSFWPFGLDLLSFWLFGPSFSFILAFWAFISFFWGLSSFHFGAATWGPPHKLPKTVRFLIKFKQILSAAKLAAFCYFWPFGPSFLFISAFWAFISFHFGLLGLHFLSFWPFGPSFPFILAFWAFISFHFGLLGLICFHFGFLGLHFLSFWPFGPSFPSFGASFWCFISFHFGLLGFHLLSFWLFGPSFPFILAFWV